MLTALVEQADAAIKKYCGRTLESATFTEYPKGYHTRSLRLKEQPVTSITSVHVDSLREFNASTLLTAGTDYQLINNMLFRVNGVWPGARENRFGLLFDAQVPSDGVIKVVYVAGYATVPADLTLAADMLVAYLLQSRISAAPYNSESLEDYSYSRDGAGNEPMIPATIRAYLAPYVRRLI